MPSTAKTAIATFAEKYAAKHAKAVTCPVRDRDALLAFHDFPAKHRDRLCTSNPVESVCGTAGCAPKARCRRTRHD